jgi:hypothetical protein
MEIIDLINPDNDAIIISPLIIENQTINKKSVRFDRSITEYFFAENKIPDEIRFMFLSDKCDKVPSSTTTTNNNTTTTATTQQMSSNGFERNERNERNEQLKVPVNMKNTISNIQSDDSSHDLSNNSIINDDNVNITNNRSNSSIDNISDINVSKRKQNRSDPDKSDNKLTEVSTKKSSIEINNNNHDEKHRKKKRKQYTPLRISTTGYLGVIDEEETQTYGVEVSDEFNQMLWSETKFATAAEAARAYDDYIYINNLENQFDLNFKRYQTTKNAFNITKDNNKWFIDDKINLLYSNSIPLAL